MKAAGLWGRPRWPHVAWAAQRGPEALHPAPHLALPWHRWAAPRSAPPACLPGRGGLCTGRCRLLINDDASGSCATSSLSSPLWLPPVRSEVKSRPAGLEFPVEGAPVCVFRAPVGGLCSLIHKDEISDSGEKMLMQKCLLSG